MTTAIKISSDQIAAAQKEIREWFPGKANAGLRATLRSQLQGKVEEIQGVEEDDVLFPGKVKLGYGVLFLNGSGDERTQNFNADINKALGLA
jgi:hypothetical protein